MKISKLFLMLLFGSISGMAFCDGGNADDSMTMQAPDDGSYAVDQSMQMPDDSMAQPFGDDADLAVDPSMQMPDGTSEMFDGSEMSDGGGASDLSMQPSDMSVDSNTHMADDAGMGVDDSLQDGSMSQITVGDGDADSDYTVHDVSPDDEQ